MVVYGVFDWFAVDGIYINIVFLTRILKFSLQNISKFRTFMNYPLGIVIHAGQTLSNNQTGE